MEPRDATVILVVKSACRASSWAIVVALASALAACADEDLPPVAESAPSGNVSSVSTDVSTSDGDAASPHACEPRSHRDCKLYYRDDSGQTHCPVSLQLCNVDGTEWLACGAYALDENGDPRAIR